MCSGGAPASLLLCLNSSKASHPSQPPCATLQTVQIRWHSTGSGGIIWKSKGFYHVSHSCFSLHPVDLRRFHHLNGSNRQSKCRSDGDHNVQSNRRLQLSQSAHWHTGTGNGPHHLYTLEVNHQDHEKHSSSSHNLFGFRRTGAFPSSRNACPCDKQHRSGSHGYSILH